MCHRNQKHRNLFALHCPRHITYVLGPNLLAKLTQIMIYVRD